MIAIYTKSLNKIQISVDALDKIRKYTVRLEKGYAIKRGAYDFCMNELFQFAKTNPKHFSKNTLLILGVEESLLDK